MTLPEKTHLFFEEVENLKEMEYHGIKIRKILINKINHKFLVNLKDNLKENLKILNKNILNNYPF